MGNIQINYALKHFEKCLCQVHLYFKESISHKSFLHKNAKSRILSNILNSYVIFLTIRNLQNLSKIYLQNFDTLCFKNLTPKYIFQFDIFIQHDYMIQLQSKEIILLFEIQIYNLLKTLQIIY